MPSSSTTAFAPFQEGDTVLLIILKHLLHLFNSPISLLTTPAPQSSTKPSHSRNVRQHLLLHTTPLPSPIPPTPPNDHENHPPNPTNHYNHIMAVFMAHTTSSSRHRRTQQGSNLARITPTTCDNLFWFTPPHYPPRHRLHLLTTTKAIRLPRLTTAIISSQPSWPERRTSRTMEALRRVRNQLISLPQPETTLFCLAPPYYPPPYHLKLPTMIKAICLARVAAVIIF